MPEGRVVTTRRSSPPGVNVFDPDGMEVFTFDTPQIFLVPGDVSVFSDGVIAICDQNSNWIETYAVDVDNQTATYLGPIAGTPGVAFIGSYVDPDDNLWATTFFYEYKVFKFSRSGSILDVIQFPQGMEPFDLVVDAGDGSIWVTVRQADIVMHVDADGQILGIFDPGVGDDIVGIAEADDGTLYVCGEESTTIRHFAPSGDLLDDIPIIDPQVPAFLMVVPEPALPGDWDGDGDVDAVDFGQFRVCSRGPGVPALPSCRDVFDFDADTDVDLHDWWVFHQSFTGEIGSQAGSHEATEPRSHEATDPRSDEGRDPRRGIKRKPATLIPPAYPEVVLDVDVDPNSPEVVIRKN